jgi:hypothetical protein
MKKITLLFWLLPFLGLSQVQIGQNINGESAGDGSGRFVSLSSDGNIVAIGAQNNDGNGLSSGHVRIYENQSGTWTQIGSDIDGELTNDFSGRSVLSSNGSIVAISAGGNDDNGFNSGHVRIYENQSGTWTQIGSDIDGEASLDNSGGSLSISSDGSIVAIGAEGNDGNGNLSGHVRIYENQSGTWTQIGSDIDGEASLDSSGSSVSLSSDGSIVAIGAATNDDNGNNSGHVRIYENQSGTWTQIGSDIDGEESSNSFGDESGKAVSLSSDGSIVAIGAEKNDANGGSSGHVRIYENQSGIWTQIGSDIDGQTAGDLFGGSVSLSSDGSIVAIGANGSDINGNNSGYVRVFQNQFGEWIQIGLDFIGEASGDHFGISVSLSSSGANIAIGATGNDGNGSNSGYVRIYDLSALLSINDLSTTEFSIYPNPTKNQFTIQLDNSVQLEKVSIYNMLGQVVLTFDTSTTLSTRENIINTSKLSSGSYIVEILTNKGKSSKKLIIE